MFPGLTLLLGGATELANKNCPIKFRGDFLNDRILLQKKIRLDCIWKYLQMSRHGRSPVIALKGIECMKHTRQQLPIHPLAIFPSWGVKSGDAEMLAIKLSKCAFQEAMWRQWVAYLGWFSFRIRCLFLRIYHCNTYDDKIQYVFHVNNKNVETFPWSVWQVQLVWPLVMPTLLCILFECLQWFS